MAAERTDYPGERNIPRKTTREENTIPSEREDYPGGRKEYQARVKKTIPSER